MQKEPNKREFYHYPLTHFISDVWGFLKPVKGRFIFWSSLRLLSAALNLLPLILLGWIVDLLTAPERDLIKVAWIVAAIGVIEIITPIMRLYSKRALVMISLEIKKSVRLSGFAKMMELDLAWHEDKASGEVMQKITAGADAINGILEFLKEDFFDIVMAWVSALVIFTYVDVKYTVLMIITIAVFLSLEAYSTRVIAQEKNRASKLMERLYGRAIEFAGNIRTIKSLGMEKAVRSRTNNAEKVLLASDRRVYRLKNRKWIWTQTATGVLRALIVAIVVWDVIKGLLTPGLLIIYASSIGKVHDALNKISKAHDDMVKNRNAVYRLMKVMNRHSEIDSGKNLKSIKNIDSIDFKDVGFSYKERPVLKDVNFSVTKGDRIGIVGQSGVGKSTLFKLMLNLYHPKSGMIRFNNLDAKKIKRSSITSRMTIVPQETELFNLSFKENIILSRPGPFDEARYRTAIHISACSAIIKNLPQGDLSIIGERGVRLSGGERQRVGIARAIYRDSDVILLDEATSHLDSKTEKSILAKLETHLKNRTLIVIAHRLSTLRSMDTILVFSEGKIVESGPYSSLLAKKGALYRLHKLQQSKESATS